MFRFVIVFVIVVALVLGGLLGLRRNAKLGQPAQDVLDRAKIREREISAKEPDS